MPSAILTLLAGFLVGGLQSSSVASPSSPTSTTTSVGNSPADVDLAGILRALEAERETQRGRGLAHVLPLPLPGETDRVREKRTRAEWATTAPDQQPTERQRLCALAAAGPLLVLVGAPTDGRSLLAGWSAGSDEDEKVAVQADGLCGLGGSWVLVSSGIPSGVQALEEGDTVGPSSVVGTALPLLDTFRYLATAATSGALGASAFAPQADHVAPAAAGAGAPTPPPSLVPTSDLRTTASQSLSDPDPHGSFRLPFVRAINDLTWTLRNVQPAALVDPRPPLRDLTAACAGSDPLPCPLVSRGDVCADVASLGGWLARDGQDEDNELTVQHAASLLHCLAMTSLSALARSPSLADHQEAQAILNVIAAKLAASLKPPSDPQLPSTLPHLDAFLSLQTHFRSLSSVVVLATLIELEVIDSVAVTNGNVAAARAKQERWERVANDGAWTHIVVVVDRPSVDSLLTASLSRLDPLALSLSLTQECLFCELVGECRGCLDRPVQQEGKAGLHDEL